MILRSAVVSACGVYRYRLERDLARPGRKALAIMVNPSRADGVIDDHTVRKCYGFCERLGIGRFIIANKCAFRATQVAELASAADPIGPDNDRHLEQAMREAELHIVAWGPLAKLPPRLRGRWREVLAIADRLGCRLTCLGTAKDGQPLHPLTLSYDRELVEWRAP